jgi:uncharacterized membrane protein
MSNYPERTFDFRSPAMSAKLEQKQLLHMILYFSIPLHCTVQCVLQFILRSACSFIVEVSCHCFTLHVSAYMAILKYVGCYYSHVLEGTCFAGFILYLARGYTLQVVTRLFVSICGVGLIWGIILLLFMLSWLLWYICFLLTCVFLFYFHPTAGNVQKRNHVQDTEEASEAGSFKNMRVITSYIHEDGHIGRNM